MPESGQKCSVPGALAHQQHLARASRRCELIIRQRAQAPIDENDRFFSRLSRHSRLSGSAEGTATTAPVARVDLPRPAAACGGRDSRAFTSTTARAPCESYGASEMPPTLAALRTQRAHRHSSTSSA